MFIKALEYVENDQVFYPIDSLEKDYEINCKGVVRNAKNKSELTGNMSSDGRIYIKVNGTAMPLSKLFLMAFFPMHTTFAAYQNVLKVGAVDTDVKNITRENLFWKIPEKEGIECKYKKGYYSIVGNPQILINKDLQFYDLVRERSLGIYFNKEDVTRYPLLSKYGRFGRESFQHVTNSVHRLVALAFLCMMTGKELVNHIDGKKDNYSLPNLELVNHTENRVHAVETGLCVQSKKVYIHNVLTKQDFVRASLWDAGRSLGVHATIITKAIDDYLNKGKLLLAPFILANNPDDIKPFDQRNLKEDVIGNGPTKYYKVEHSERIGVQYVRGRVELASVLKVTQTDRLLLSKYLSPKEFELYGYVINPVHKEEVPSEFTEIVRGQKGGGKTQKPISVTHLRSGVVTEYPNTDVFATLVGAFRKTIQRRMLYNDGVWNGYKIVFLK